MLENIISMIIPVILILLVLAVLAASAKTIFDTEDPKAISKQ